MARRRYRRYRRRRGRWSANIQQLNLTGAAHAGTRFGDSVTIAQNPVQTTTTVSQQYTVKNIEVTGLLESAGSNANIDDIAYYIMYVPEGYAISLDLPFNHPEWIMAYKYIGQSSSVNSSNAFYEPPRIKTRLSRRLNTGDSVIFLYNGLNSSAGGTDIKFNGLVRWWTKAN